jgi:crossover junction endodeoxyribonuclease RusA
MSAEMRVVFPWSRPPLSLNDRRHRMQEAKIVKDVRAAAAFSFATFPPVPRVEVLLTWQVKDSRKRDDENPVLTLKALCDGLVDAGIVPDDTSEFMVKHMPRIVLVRGEAPCVILDVREVA